MKGPVLLLLCIALPWQLAAHQPVMDMAPRWSGGYGIQTRVEHANSASKTWLEGVYTFKPAVRMTLKVPYQSGDIGDSIFAVPLKRYRNEGAFTSNWSITPSVKAPTGGGSSWETGAGISYSSESKSLYQLYDLYTLGSTNGLDINVGWVFADGAGSSWFTLWDVSAVDSPAGQRLLSGPVLVYFHQNIIWRAEYKFEVRDDDEQWDGDFLSFGIGMVF
ncbi:MAG: hypothetical protein WBN40_01895 [Pseudomonadales bacterium]